MSSIKKNPIHGAKYNQYTFIKVRKLSSLTTMYGYLINTETNTQCSTFSSLRQMQKARNVFEILKTNSTQKTNLFSKLDEQFFVLLSIVFCEERILNENLLSKEIARLTS